MIEQNNKAMKNTAISMHQLLNMFPNEASARHHLEKIRWNNQPICPECNSDSIYARKGKRLGMFDCRDCGKHFSVRTGTIFEKPHISLNKWIFAIYILKTACKSVSSMQLSKEIDITQKSAWFVLHRLRLGCGNNLKVLRGIVEIEETYMAGKKKNRRTNKQTKGGRGELGKQAVLVFS